MALGVGVMINMLGGNTETVNLLAESVDKVISELYVDPDYNSDGGLIVKFNDGTGIVVFDAARSCCESRFMECDENLDYFVGSKFTGVEIRDYVTKHEEYDTCETQFVNVITSKGVFEVKTYNNHNGYYGGFYMKVARL